MATNVGYDVMTHIVSLEWGRNVCVFFSSFVVDNLLTHR